jgi:3-isopropylmalate/(R)-2-methylmalate dehydratase small subunit
VDQDTRKQDVLARVVFCLGDNISTDAIYPGRFMATVLPGETPQYAFADFTEFNARLRRKEIAPGGVIVAGANFGCGSSREQAVSTLKGHELTVVARGFARIFLQNAVNLGLQTIACREIAASEGDELEISADIVFNRTTGCRFPVQALPPAKQAIMAAGGLIPYTRRRLLEGRASIGPEGR